MKTHRKIKMDVVSLIAGMLNPASKGQLNSASRTRPPPHPPKKGPPGSPPSTTRLFYFLPQFQISAMMSHYHTQIICVLNISVLYANMLLSYSSNGQFPQSKSISARATCDELSGQRPTGASASFSGFSSCGAKSSTDAGSSLRHSRGSATQSSQRGGWRQQSRATLWCLLPPGKCTLVPASTHPPGWHMFSLMHPPGTCTQLPILISQHCLLLFPPILVQFLYQI